MDKPVGRNISIQQIEIFLKAVELCNFSKAAATLNFTPSMVSKTILSMENELGIELFIRQPHELTPTPAAQMLASEWRRLVGSYDYAVTKARAIQQNRLSRLQISFVDSSDQVDELMKQAISRYEELYPSADVIVEKHDMHRAAELLHFGLLDLAVTSAIEIPYLKEHRISYEQLTPTSTMVYIPEKNPLFRKEEICFSDLKEQPFAALNPKMHPCYDRWLHEICEAHGFVPRIETTFRTVRSLLFGLDLHEQVFLGESVTADWCGPKLKAFDLDEPSAMILAWRPENEQAVKELKDLLKEVF